MTAFCVRTDALASCRHWQPKPIQSSNCGDAAARRRSAAYFVSFSYRCRLAVTAAFDENVAAKTNHLDRNSTAIILLAHAVK